MKTNLRVADGTFAFNYYTGWYHIDGPLIRISREFVYLENREYMTLEETYSYVVLPNES